MDVYWLRFEVRILPAHMWLLSVAYQLRARVYKHAHCYLLSQLER
jgi:hypothetical protein